MKGKTLYSIVILLYTSAVVNARPQQQEQQNFEDIVNTIFTSPRPVGFGEIITAEPIVGPTSEPQIFQNSEGQCQCVPYHMCDPRNNSVAGADNNADNLNDIDGFGLIDIRFDKDTCQDVLDVCCGEKRTVTAPIQLPPLEEIKPNRSSGCGVRNVGGIDFTLVGNLMNEAGFGEFPWTTAIIEIPDEKCLCGASLIHPQVVLTGNHCVRKYQKKPSSLKVRAGEWDTQTNKERLPFQERIVRSIISHPDYDLKTLANDFALLVMERAFELSDHINVVCLPPAGYISSNEECFASGWGKDIFGKAGKRSVIMKRVPLPIVPNDVCQAELRKTRLGETFNLHPTFLCAGGRKGIDTCEGDGGAPLVCPVGPPEENRFSQSGIVAWGIGCHEARPAVYASVAEARDWIDEQIIGLGFNTNVYTY